MNRTSGSGLSPAKLRRQVWLGAVRSLVTVIVLVVLYYQLPLDHVRNVLVTLVVGVVILAVVTVLQLRVISRSPLPAVRAIEALATVLPLFLLLFASAYVVMADANPANFNTHPLTRTDALYFTVTVFSTVGFGDITAASQSARVVVMVQMLLDLAALGLVVRAFVSAVQSARQAAPDTPPQRKDDAGLLLAFEDPLRGAGGETPQSSVLLTPVLVGGVGEACPGIWIPGSPSVRLGPGGIMTDNTYRVTEIVGTSPEGIDSAIRNALQRAGATLRHLDWFEVTEVRGQIEGSEVATWQVGLKVGFRLE